MRIRKWSLSHKSNWVIQKGIGDGNVELDVRSIVENDAVATQKWERDLCESRRAISGSLRSIICAASIVVTCHAPFRVVCLGVTINDKWGRQVIGRGLEVTEWDGKIWEDVSPGKIGQNSACSGKNSGPKFYCWKFFSMTPATTTTVSYTHLTLPTIYSV